MRNYFESIILGILVIPIVNITLTLLGIYYLLVFSSVALCIYGLYRIIVPISKDTYLKEECLSIYSKKSGLLHAVFGLFLFVFLFIYDFQSLYYLVWPLAIIFSYFVLFTYIRRKYRKAKKEDSEENIEKNTPKNRFANSIIALLLINVLLFAAIAIFPSATKGVLLFSNNIHASDIIYEYRVNSDNRIDTTFLLYLKNDEEIGFVRMEPSNVNTLFPLLPFRVFAYSVSSKCVINIQTGNVNIIWNRYIDEWLLDKNAKKYNIRLMSDYWYSEYVLSSEDGFMETRRGLKYFYMGIKHEFAEIEGVEYKFIQYFDEVFDGIYVYFFVNYEQLEYDHFLHNWTIRYGAW